MRQPVPGELHRPLLSLSVVAARDLDVKAADEFESNAVRYVHRPVQASAAMLLAESRREFTQARRSTAGA